ncbi:DUF2946 family protein [Massilia sp. CMS3.1]|uniref:DUF2946 family protein n=1 Tax=Massilia sp. CMS3.1 TaxID=3373083 RepID=UPI003EE808F4
MTRLFRHALATWIALLALLFGALAPTLSHAFVRAGGPAIEFPICSAVGHTAADVKTAGLPDLGPDPFQHCPYCADGHHAPGLLPKSPAVPVVVGSPVHPFLFYQSSEPSFHWAASKSRGPPLVS